MSLTAEPPASRTDYRTPQERLLASLTEALQQHGLGPNVGLLGPGTFPQHRGGTGILVGFPRDECAASRPAAEWLLKEMGAAWVRDHAIGIEAHLRGELRPAPEVPPRAVTSGDSATEAACDPEPGKKCNGPCGRVLPLAAFAWRVKERGWRVPYCRDCERARQKRQRVARAQRAA